MEKQTAEAIAKKGLAFIKSAAKTGAAAFSQGVATVRKGYATKHEADVLSDLKSQGLHPAEHLHAALRKLNYLYLSGYKHELQAVAQQAAKRLTDPERSTVPLDSLLCMSSAICEESLKHGDFNQGKLFQGFQDFLNKAKMGSNHFDRDKLSHDLYYSTLYIVEEYEGALPEMDKICREVISHVITTAPTPDVTSLPVSKDPTDSPQYNAAKSCFYYFMALNRAAQELDDKRMKALREAEALVQREQEKFTQSSQRPSPQA
ncbi:uncharacterized protein [Physcomitrium patens]|nr:uncharacterized protein LOC112295117 isoform X2 [Physcomitrium patens]XP_024402084.1 uncharacterized protein LOC112295117 isoform X2 [Physcomitrium patens]XP_024402085.1 uncharacterized protein LOC112295117 isoform X2 [Physcomitrium patens]XP_024402086.1 uncharacterized protein LOC112295117 isoform X2 [Physcomitrium patens]|eukprot:XP_024402083.1 uncharacterized protein LOC112295117 isoform X2 [Physcomitrella patens]